MVEPSYSSSVWNKLFFISKQMLFWLADTQVGGASTIAPMRLIILVISALTDNIQNNGV